MRYFFAPYEFEHSNCQTFHFQVVHFPRPGQARGLSVQADLVPATLTGKYLVTISNHRKQRNGKPHNRTLFSGRSFRRWCRVAASSPLGDAVRGRRTTAGDAVSTPTPPLRGSPLEELGLQPTLIMPCRCRSTEVADRHRQRRR